MHSRVLVYEANVRVREVCRGNDELKCNIFVPIEFSSNGQSFLVAIFVECLPETGRVQNDEFESRTPSIGESNQSLIRL